MIVTLLHPPILSGKQTFSQSSAGFYNQIQLHVDMSVSGLQSQSRAYKNCQQQFQLTDGRPANVAQNAHDVDMDNERELFGLCSDQFGPKPLCFGTGCYPSAPLEATSQTSHNPIHGDKYVQCCSSERPLICRIGWFYCQRKCLVSRMSSDHAVDLQREKSGFSKRHSHTVREPH